MLELTKKNPPWGIFIIISGVPILILTALYFFSEFGVVCIIGIVFFTFVGVLNYYIPKSRPVPLKVRMTKEGLWFIDDWNQERKYIWAEVNDIKVKIGGLRGFQRVEVYFTDNSEPLKLYTYAMHLPNPRFSDQMVKSWETWDQPVKQARAILKKNMGEFTDIAQYNLGLMYETGQGVPQDFKTAVQCYRPAAEQGYAPAQFNLGAMYALGNGVIQDNVYAYMWGNIAATNGNKRGAKLRDFVAKEMTPSQLETAQKLARECIRKNYKGC